MAEYGEWNRKGATFRDVTAQKEYGIDRNFIVKGIRAGKLEFREKSVWGTDDALYTAVGIDWRGYETLSHLLDDTGSCKSFSGLCSHTGEYGLPRL